MAVWERPQAEAWTHLTDHLDIPATVEPGDRITVSGPDAPLLSGVVVKADPYCYSLLMDAPILRLAMSFSGKPLMVTLVRVGSLPRIRKPE